MGGLLSAPKAAPLPAPEPPARAPDPDNELSMRRQRRSAAARVKQAGRASTILRNFSSNAEGLGG